MFHGICEQCGKAFQCRKRSERKLLFCSRACANLAQKQSLVWCICEYCGKSFQRSRSRVGPYCSDACSRTRPVAKGVEHWNWKGGISRRSRAVGAASHKKVQEIGRCERCGSMEDLHGHHVEHYANAPERGTDPKNIKVLCAPCHALEHPEIRNLIVRPYVRDGKEIACLICGQLRYVNPCQVARAKYCSIACLAVARRRGDVRTRWSRSIPLP
jgi:hypothetical protein